MLDLMTTTLVTGANKGLGFETTRRLIAAGHTVYLGARDEQRGKQAASELGARPVLIDVTSDDSVHAAAAHIRERAGHLDVLVNNAGIGGGRARDRDLPEPTSETWTAGAAVVFGRSRPGRWPASAREMMAPWSCWPSCCDGGRSNAA
jgi:NAD(P)-dependent dehydrogenase (short-subunit alcohol dehydrogenase family)